MVRFRGLVLFDRIFGRVNCTRVPGRNQVGSIVLESKRRRIISGYLRDTPRIVIRSLPRL